MNELKYDKNLWFEHSGCEGDHFLIGNPQTHYGRMWAWCLKENRSIFVSKSEIINTSDQTKYWIKGFLAGNQPPAPINKDGSVDFESAIYNTWLLEIELFNETGYWWSGDPRNCDKCNSVLLASEPNDMCNECRA